MRYEKMGEKGHTVLRTVHLTSSDNLFPLTENTTLARNASCSLPRQHTRLTKNFYTLFSQIMQGSSGMYMKKVWKQKYQQNQKHITQINGSQVQS